MDFKEVRCRVCGANMKIEDGASRAKCEFCETEYVLSSNPQNSPVKLIDWQGRGPVFKAYIPEGWNYRIFDDDSASFICPVPKGLQMQSREGKQLIFFPEAYYKNYAPGKTMINPGSFGKVRDYLADGWSLICWRRLVDPQQYVSERLMRIFGGLNNLNLQYEDDKELVERLQYFPNKAAQNLGGQVSATAYKFKMTFSMNGRNYHGLFATAFASLMNAAGNTQKSSGGGVADLLKGGLQMLGGMMGGLKEKSDWGRAFDLVIVAPEGEGLDSDKLLHDFIREFEYGPVYYALQDEDRQKIKEIEMQGMMTRQQNAIRSSQNISRTLSQTSDIVNSACWDHAQGVNRMIDHSTDGIRGVNTFSDSAGRYEADVKYDYIYRKGDTFIGSTDGSLDLGPQWEELKKE